MIAVTPVMPHSTALEPIFSEALVMDDTGLPNALEEASDPTKEEESMDMVIDDVSHTGESIGEVSRTEVKLEDIFNDVNDDEDDDFSGSGVSNANNESNSPAAPV